MAMGGWIHAVVQLEHVPNVFEYVILTRLSVENDILSKPSFENVVIWSGQLSGTQW
jgi:hypothetical protein